MKKLFVTCVVLCTLGLGGAFAQTGGSEAPSVPLNPEVSGEVEFWHFWGSPVRRNAVRRVVSICEEKLPNITVTETFKPWGDIWTANIAAVAAGSGMPDVIVSDRPQLPSDAADGVYENLGEFAGQDGISADAFWPFTWQQALYEGEPYGVPFETDVRVLYYNKTLFEQAGLDPENPPQTWEELEAAADALDRVEDGNIERIGFSPLLGDGPPAIWVLNNEHDWVQDGVPVVDDPAVAETFEWVREWLERYGGYEDLQRFTSAFGAPPNDYFMSGRVAMIMQTAGYSSVLNFYRPKIELEDGSSANLDWGVTMPPHAEGAESTSDSGGFALSIPAGAENPEAAWEFIKCATGPEAQVSWSRDTYAIPTRVEAARNPQLTADPNWDLFIDAIEAVEPSNSTFVPSYPNWKQELGSRYEQVWTGQMSVEEMLEEAQTAVDRTMEENQ